MSDQIRADRLQPGCGATDATAPSPPPVVGDTEGQDGQDEGPVEKVSAIESVPGPNTVPTNGRYESSSDNYAAGYPEIAEPQWLLDVADRMAAQHASST